jgi:hypothetical protein
MPNNLFSSAATHREVVKENRGGATPISLIRMSIREIAEQKLNQLGCYIRAAYGCNEDDRWQSSKERTRTEEWGHVEEPKLEHCYGRIGISAVIAALPFHNTTKKRATENLNSPVPRK